MYNKITPNISQKHIIWPLPWECWHKCPKKPFLFFFIFKKLKKLKKKTL
jgi:hypothetical protein